MFHFSLSILGILNLNLCCRSPFCTGGSHILTIDEIHLLIRWMVRLPVKARWNNYSANIYSFRCCKYIFLQLFD